MNIIERIPTSEIIKRKEFKNPRLCQTSLHSFCKIIILGNMFLSNSNSEEAASYMMLLSNNEYQCCGCEHRSKFKNNMIKHIDSKHINHGPESCQFCQKQCSSKQALQKHISRYHRDLNV